MKKLYQDFLQRTDPAALMRETEALWQCEFGQTFEAYHKAAEYTLELINKAGIPNGEIFYVPADGKTTFNDICMPKAWDATVGKFTLLNAPEIGADFEKHPFHLIKGSVATAPGGEIMRIISQEQFLAGENPAGALVMLAPETLPRSLAIKNVLDRGARGIISDWITNREQHYDDHLWINAGTEEVSAWHVFDDHRDFVSFSVSPRTGDAIRKAIRKGPVRAKVECDGRRYNGTLPGITALIPGRKKEEVWIYAHMYEPLSDDDANGVVAGIHTARMIMEKGTPEYSIRLLFAMELYGYMAYICQQGSYLRNKVIGGCNFDALASVKGAGIMLYPSGPATPFSGNLLAGALTKALQNVPGALKCDYMEPRYFDDISFADPTIGIPALWPIGEYGDSHHSSVQTMDFLDEKIFAAGTAFNTVLIWCLANPEKSFAESSLEFALEELEKTAASGCSREKFTHLYNVARSHLADFKRGLPEEEINPLLEKFRQKFELLNNTLKTETESADTPWRRQASQTVMKRLRHGFPHNQVAVPREERIPLPESVIYGPFANILANMDGKRSCGELIRLAGYECNREFSEADIKKYLDALNHLCDFGYLESISRPELDKQDIVQALQKLGVSSSDVLLIHASLSRCGYISGGCKTVISALRETADTVLFPTFTHSCVYANGPVQNWYLRPWDSQDAEQIFTGKITRYLVRNTPDVQRSQHVTHSWAGLGKKAESCLKAHSLFDAPCSENSPLAKVLEADGKVLCFGCGLDAVTFLHFLETQSGVPYLHTAFCQAKTADGRIIQNAVEKYFSGPRDFYRPDAENSKFFKKAVAMGLEIKKVQLGTGQLQLIDLRQLFDIGMLLLKQDPDILLCDE
ncbi:MAG: DUF4910 domain-containing protein [Lentisphaeria bacterium]|nr:DUF4910 domain-containing protein [Lentisphaeria bacterium]